jgi:hypothetical protein
MNKKKYIEYNLHNVHNYESTINYNSYEAFNNYKLIISEYIKLISENNYFINKNNYKLIIIKGIDVFSHIFNIILLHTKSLQLATYHSQKSYFFYIEFIEQMYQDSNAFLKLNHKDAVLFLYKKTIFEINDNHIKNIKLNTHENKFFNTLNIYIQIFNTFIHYIISSNEDMNIYTNIDFYNNNLLKLTTILDNIKNNDNILNIILILINKSISYNFSSHNTIQLLQSFSNYFNQNTNLNIKHLEKIVYITNFSSIQIDENTFRTIM